MTDQEQIRDLPRVLADHASDIVMFDVPPPERARAAIRSIAPSLICSAVDSQSMS